MNRRNKLILVLIAIFISTEIYSQTNIETNDINDLALLEGTWEADFGSFKYYEEWKMEDDKLIGKGYRIKEGETFNGEQLLLIKIHGYISYIATVGTQQPILFALKNRDHGNYVFENKEHDFPQKIIYNIIDNDTIKVYVSGEMNGEITQDEYNMTRVDD